MRYFHNSAVKFTEYLRIEEVYNTKCTVQLKSALYMNEYPHSRGQLSMEFKLAFFVLSF